MAQPVPLNPAQHANLRVRVASDLESSVGQQVLPITVFEFSRAGNDCPVVFVKHAETGQFQSVMLLGLSRNENLMYRDGEWQGTYVPEVLRMGPFKLIRPNAQADIGAVGIDLDSSLVSDGEGEPLFDAEGNPSEFLQEARNSLETYYQQSHATHAFISLLAERDLLSQQTLTMDIDGESVKLEGIYLVDDRKINELPDETALDYYKRGMLQAVYAHLMSLRQATRLARMKAATRRAAIRGA